MSFRSLGTENINFGCLFRGSGIENIDTSYCYRTKIQVFSSPEGNRDAVGEHTLGMLLMLQNHLKRADDQVRNGIWKRAENRGYELKGKTVGIIGYGVMGKSFAQRLSGFEVKLIAYDKYKEKISLIISYYQFTIYL